MLKGKARDSLIWALVVMKVRELLERVVESNGDWMVLVCDGGIMLSCIYEDIEIP